MNTAKKTLNTLTANSRGWVAIFYTQKPGMNNDTISGMAGRAAGECHVQKAMDMVKRTGKARGGVCGCEHEHQPICEIQK